MNYISWIVLLTTALSAVGQVTLVPSGSVWNYFAAGPVATNWFRPDFDDESWLTGPSQLGYGEGDEQTVLFTNWSAAPRTIYFRQAFFLTNAAGLNTGTLRLLADDGAVVYLNGTEVARKNMPAGPADFWTDPLSNLEINENSFAQFGFYGYRFKTGYNLLAVELHQHPAGLMDASFDLELLANIPVGPPSVAISSPTNDTVITSGDVVLQTALTDPAGQVMRVEFYTNGCFVGEATNEPFSFHWTAPPVGHYRLTARAFDNFFLFGDSGAVHLQVGAGATPQMFRAPYLQSGSSTNVLLRWRTDWLSDSVVRWGTNAGFLEQAFTNNTRTIDHEVNLTGLQPATVYFYAVGSSAQTFSSGQKYFFRTSPTNATPCRIWAIGDFGTADTNAAAVRDAYYNLVGSNYTDLWLMLGDNAYYEGSDANFQAAVFNMYGGLLRRTVVWPTIGNHDANDDPGAYGNHAAPYLDIFSLPEHGEAGGVPSGSEHYYSFDYANIHLVCLDSFLSDRSADGPMLTWLKDDLAATDKDWIIAFWHHPPYSWGTHDSDYEPELREMRENAVPILEAYGVDLVLSGHSHNYERSFLINGQYQPSWELQPDMVLDSGLGRADLNAPYRKPAGGIGAHKGTVYTVCGCSGQGGMAEDSFRKHPVMAVTHGGFGSMVIEVNGLKLRARFLRPSLDFDDDFTIDKSAPTTVAPRLNVWLEPTGAVLAWPTSRPSFTLEAAQSFLSFQWQALALPVTTIGRLNSVSVEMLPTNWFFRLRAAP